MFQYAISVTIKYSQICRIIIIFLIFQLESRNAKLHSRTEHDATATCLRTNFHYKMQTNLSDLPYHGVYKQLHTSEIN